MKKPTSRAATTVNKSPAKPKKTYTTSAGAQQYVRGNNSDERRANLLKAQNSVTRQDRFNPALANSLSAAQSANASREIKKIVGPKKAKTDSTVKMYNRMEREGMARAKSKLNK